MAMHKVLKSYLEQFSKDFEKNDLDEADQFERFVNFCIINRSYPDSFDIEDVTTGVDDWSIDGAAIIIGDELVLTQEDAISVFDRLRSRQTLPVLYVFIQAKRSDSFDGGDMAKFGAGVTSLLTDTESVLTDDVLVEIRKIHEVVVSQLSKVQGGRPKCSLHYVTSGVWGSPKDLIRIIGQQVNQLNSTSLFTAVEFLPVDREALITHWIQTLSPVEATFLVKGYVPIPNIVGVQEAYLTVVSASEFVDKVLTGEDGRIRSHVFEQNVRAFLGDDNLVNSRIGAGLTDPNSRDRFAILNNGITLVSPDIKVQSERVSAIDFQIVNGCQTSHVLFRNRHLLTDNVYVSVKLVEAEDPEIVSQVVQATNSQSDVEETQFLSLSPFVRKIEAYFNSFDTEAEKDKRLYFERRTRQYAGTEIGGRNRVFDIQRLARAFAAMFLDVPHLAARYPTQTLKEKADVLYQSDHKEIAYYTAALALYRLELSFNNDYVPASYKSKKWHLLMAMKYLSGGGKVPPLNSNKLESYCQTIIDALEGGGKSSAAPFLAAKDRLDALGIASRDRLKRQTFTDEIKASLLA